jgi:hypothetical protein
MKKLIVSLVAMFASSVCLASPYIGVDYQHRISEVKRYQSNVFAKKAHGYHLHAGYYLSEDYSIEGGYHLARTSKLKGSHKMRGIHGAFVKHFMLSTDKTWQAVASFGLTHAKHTLTHDSFVVSKAKPIPRLMGGLEYHVTPNVAFRASLIFEGTSFLDSKKDNVKFGNSYGFNVGTRFLF